MLKRMLRLTMVTLVSVFGCSRSIVSIPQTAMVIAEDKWIAVFLNQEDKDEVPQVSIWLKRKETGAVKQLLITHPRSFRGWMTTKRSVSIPIDSIATISKVTILSYGDCPATMLVEGCADGRNVESYIISETSNVAICLPTNGGLLGIAAEEYTLIMQSYDYYDCGGRFSVITAFDAKGNMLGRMNVKTLHNYDTR